MITHFDSARWVDIARNYGAWWDDSLDRPIFHVVITGADPGIEKPEGYRYPLFSAYPLDGPMDALFSHIRYLLCGHRYLGDAYPTYLPDFGAGVNAAFCGCKYEVRPETVWFMPEKPTDAATLRLVHDPENALFKRICEFYTAADEYFGGDIVLGMTHLNNGIDIPARFIDGVEFCLAMYDEPEHVERLVWENHHLTMFYAKTFHDLMKHNNGHTMWGDIFAPVPWLGSQSDFCAMIGPKPFDRFVLPELVACMAKSPRYNFYHLDGRGELTHLDKILNIPHLQIVQWVISAGDPDPDENWMWLYKKIRNAGKKIWYTGPEKNLDLLADTLGDLRGVYWQAYGGPKDEERLRRTLERFGVPASD